jgi:hypothetical protein
MEPANQHKLSHRHSSDLNDLSLKDSKLPPADEIQGQSITGPLSALLRVERALAFAFGSNKSRVELSGAMAPDADYRYSGLLLVDDKRFELTLDNFRPAFALQQTIRDLRRDRAMPQLVSGYLNDTKSPLVIYINGERCELSRHDEAGLLLMLIGRKFTDDTP